MSFFPLNSVSSSLCFPPAWCVGRGTEGYMERLEKEKPCPTEGGYSGSHTAPTHHTFHALTAPVGPSPLPWAYWSLLTILQMRKLSLQSQACDHFSLCHPEVVWVSQNPKPGLLSPNVKALWERWCQVLFGGVIRTHVHWERNLLLSLALAWIRESMNKTSLEAF